MAEPKKRIVQVFVVDPHDSISLDRTVLYKGEQKLTDATDQELFFEIGIKELLDKHNEYRVTVKDLETEDHRLLQPAKIRDLKMVVVNIATF